MVRVLALLLLATPAIALGLADDCDITAGTCTIDELPEDCSDAGCTCSCTGGDNNDIIDADDTVIVAGAAVTASSTLAFNDAADTGFQNVTSGSLEWEADLVLTQNENFVPTGGTFTVDGRILTNPGNASPAFTATVDGWETMTPLGTVFHCPADIGGGVLGEDCENAFGGLTTQSALCWNSSLFDVAGSGLPGEVFYPEWVAAITDDSVVVFFDPMDTGFMAGHDVNSMYEVDDADTWGSPDNCIIIDVTQSDGDPPSGHWPRAERQIVELVIDTLETKGTRVLDELDAGTISADHQYRARYLTCEDSAGNFPGWTVGITRTTDGGGGDDTFLLDPPGLPETVDGVSSARKCFIDWGWLPGDPLFVMDPAEYTSASAATVTDTNFQMNGTTADIRQLLIRHGNIAAFLQGPVTSRNLWIYDTSNTASVATMIYGSTSLTAADVIGTAKRTFISGSGGGASGSGMHCSRASGGRMIIEDFHCRYNADDTLYVDQTGGVDVHLTVRRLRSSYINGAGGSHNGIDCAFNTTTCVIEAEGVLLEANSLNAGDYDLGCNASGTCTYRGVVSVGGYIGRFTKMSDPGDPITGRFEIHDAYDLGRSECCVGVSIGAVFENADMYRLTSRDLIIDNDADDFLMMDTVGAGPAFVQKLQRALFINTFTTNDDLIEVQDPAEWQDVMFLDPDTSSATTSDAVFTFTGTGTGANVELKRITGALSPGGTTAFEEFVQLGSTTHDFTWVLEGHCIVNWDDDDSSSGIVYDAVNEARVLEVDWGSIGPYLFNNELDIATEAWADSFPSTISRGVPLHFVDPARGNFSPVRGSPAYGAGACARNVGTGDNWAYRVRFGNRTPFENGDSWTAGGAGGGCQPGPSAQPGC